MIAEKESPTHRVKGLGGFASKFSSFPRDRRLKLSNEALTNESENKQGKRSYSVSKLNFSVPSFNVQYSYSSNQNYYK